MLASEELRSRSFRRGGGTYSFEWYFALKCGGGRAGGLSLGLRLEDEEEEDDDVEVVEEGRDGAGIFVDAARRLPLRLRVGAFKWRMKARTSSC